MRYRVYHVFSLDKTNMIRRWGCILIDAQDSLFELWSCNYAFTPYRIPRKRITFKIIGILMSLHRFREIERKYLDDSTLVTKEYELLPNNSSK